MPGAISLVIPTFNRADALRQNLGVMLALEGVDEVIVVNDGSSDNTLAVCDAVDDPRLTVITHPRNRGVATARNTGVEASTGEWVLFGEDDCRFPPDYAVVLRSEAELNGGDIVGAPIVHHTGTTDEGIAAYAAGVPRVDARPSLEQVNVFVARPTETPFLCALALVRRRVFESVRFYEGYPVNGFREETDFFIQAARSGFRCLLTSATYSYQLTRWTGGQHSAPVPRYEYWLLRNNWHFLERHGSWLTEHGYIRSRSGAEVKFAIQRAREVGGGYTRARLRRARAALTRGAAAG